MIKRSRLAFVFMLMLTIVTTMAILVPGVAQAAIVDPTVSWSGEALQGYDPFYDSNVMAFVEGSKAKVSFVFMNDMGPGEATVVPYIDLDWGTRYYGAPVKVAGGQPVTLYIEFDVPTVAATGGLTPHGWGIGTEFQLTTEDYRVNSEVGEGWEAPGGDDTYVLNNHPMIGSSLVVWTEDGTGWEGVSPDDYSVNAWTGEIDFDSTPDMFTNFLFNYDYYQNLGTGDGVNQDFVVMAPPAGKVVDGTLAVYVTNEAAEEVEQHTTGWTFNSMTGLLTFTSAPTPNQDILARWQYRLVHPDRYWSAEFGTTFAIMGQDQADAMTLWRRYRETSDTEDVDGWISASAQQLWSQAEAARAKGEIEYREGQFTAAKASLQTAVDRLNASIAAAIAFMKTAQEMRLASDNAQLNLAVAEVGQIQAENALIPKEGTYLDAQTASLNAQTARINALTEAEKGALKASNSREKSYGTFVILIGVFLILVGVAMLLLAVGMFLKWRKPAAGST